MGRSVMRFLSIRLISIREIENKEEERIVITLTVDAQISTRTPWN